jgi:hypothetical protein
MPGTADVTCVEAVEPRDQEGEVVERRASVSPYEARGSPSEATGRLPLPTRLCFRRSKSDAGGLAGGVRSHPVLLCRRTAIEDNLQTLCASCNGINLV